MSSHLGKREIRDRHCLRFHLKVEILKHCLILLMDLVEVQAHLVEVPAQLFV